MNFEKVELYGFKSFADKAEITFGNGITAIVGPNGCGKSNVADAIRWVLGEQSAKSLRGSTMQDVIFAGTQGRKSLSYCEVSLFFDNSSKMFSVDYNEVVITRKLFRSGESEYYINKQPARLRDIVDLLHECGVGKEGYSIIGQGKVEEIMSAKPEDRRMIFEEATGIAKFKTRKIESERKLERTHENVIRYSDILSEIENQLVPLERQAEKAREFNQISEELKFNEINTYIAKVEGVATAKNKISVKIKGIDDETALRQSELEETQKLYEKILNDINSADEKLKDLNNELLVKRVGMEKSSGAKQLFEQKISSLLGQVERAETQINQYKILIENSERAVTENGQLKEDTEKQLKELNKKFDALSKKLNLLNQKITLGEELANENRKKVIATIESLSDIKLNKGTISVEKRSLLEKHTELTQRLDSLSVKREEIFNEKAKCDKAIDDLDRAVYDLKNKISSKEDEVRNGNEDVARVDNDIYLLNSVLSTLSAKENFYKGLKDNYDGYMSSVKLLMTEARENRELKTKIKGVVAELIKNDKKYDIALETALAAGAQNVVTETPDDANYVINYLKQNKMGRVTFLPITSVKSRQQLPEVLDALSERGALGVADRLVSYEKQYYSVISNLLGNTLIVDNIDNATFISKKYRNAFKIVTLDGDVITPQGAMTGGSRRTDVVGLLSSDRKIEENAEQLASKKRDMDKLKEKKEKLEQSRDKALDELNILNDLYNGKREQILIEREKQGVNEKSLSEIGREIEGVNELIADVDNRIKVMDSNLLEVSSGSKKAEEEKLSAKESADKHQLEYDALLKERETLSNESTEMQVKITELNGVISNCDIEDERLNKSIIDSKNSIAQLERANKNNLLMVEELKIEQEKVALTKEEQDAINKIREKIEGLDSEKVELRKKLSSNEEKKQSVSERLSELSEKKHLEEIALAKIDSDLEYMGQSIFEDYQETYETAIKKRAENYDSKQGEQEIIKLRKRRSSLGAINANAIEEYKILKDRYEEMTTQKQDLVKAEEDLKIAINKIRDEMQSQFDEGFTKINENFQKIFKELFGGGRAMLQMDYTAVDDKLEAGVEIVAEPPGKRLQKLSLLSGGEKALTAIAILFAILRLRPMPFCVLDEIEAALDEANVDRFASYLKKFSEETQFIVITHRKPTMEKADALFGVTMQEKGVSKTVSVKLSDVVDMEGDTLA